MPLLCKILMLHHDHVFSRLSCIFTDLKLTEKFCTKIHHLTILSNGFSRYHFASFQLWEETIGTLNHENVGTNRTIPRTNAVSQNLFFKRKREKKEDDCNWEVRLSANLLTMGPKSIKRVLEESITNEIVCEKSSKRNDRSTTSKKSFYRITWR